MRLTLRTMLAYLDDVLDQVDARELEHKIAESSFATGLVQRIRDSMRRSRLGAPKLEGKGLGLDPNTVAEYLDNEMASESVPEFEKICLESDVHLAEVASCHQILAVVMREPLQVDNALRERMYRIGHPENRERNGLPNTAGNGASKPSVERDRAEERATPVASVASLPNRGLAVDVAPIRRASGLPLKSLAITLVLGFLIAWAALQAVGVSKFRSLIGLPQPPHGEPNLVNLPEPVKPTPETQLANAEANLVEKPLAPRPIQPTEHEPRVIDSARPDPITAEPVSKPSVVPVPSLALTEEDPAPMAAVGTLPAAEIVPRPVESEPKEITDPPTPEVSGADAVAEEDRGRQLPVGRFISEEQVLARFDAAAGAWFRLAPDSPVLSDERLVSLPTYRPQLLLSPSVKLTLVGESHIQLGKPQASGGPRLTMKAGRAMIVPIGDRETEMDLGVAERQGTILFASTDSVLAVEVLPYLAPGQHPELTPASIITQLFAVSGQIAWGEDGEDDAFFVNPGQVLVMIDDKPPVLYESGELPTWIAGKDLSDIDQLSSRELRRELATDRSLVLSLMERAEFRQIEVRSLACRALCSLDNFEPSIEALGGTGLRSYWFAQFDALRTALARSPDAAAKLQRTLEKLSTVEAGLMYQLLCGYGPEQLAAGGAKQLVDALEHERTNIRVLAYENLRRITDKTQLFRPEQPPAQQKGEITRWRRNLESGAIVYQKPPTPLPERRAVVLPHP